MIRHIIFVFILAMLCIGCYQTPKVGYTYFGGKIIHPKDSIVVLISTKDFRDTLKLSSDHTFMKKYENFDGGLYYFNHGNEYQYVFIEAHDSLLLRLNTWDFDESLVFSGKNAETNNLLVETFLAYERNEWNISRREMANVNEFMAKMDTMLAEKKEILTNYQRTHTSTSTGFLEIYRIALTFPIYTELERYMIAHYMKFKSDSLKHKLLKYRNDIQLGRDSLLYYRPYYDYVRRKMYNEATLKGYARESEDFVIHLLNGIDKEVNDEKIKNKILYEIVKFNFMKRGKNNDYQKVFVNYFKLSSDLEHKKEMQRLIQDINYMNEQEKLPNFKVEVAATGDWVAIRDFLPQKHTIICLGNSTYFSTRSVSSHFNYLFKNYPEVNFMLIHQNKRNTATYIEEIDRKYQYKLVANSKAYKFLTSNFPRLIIVNKNKVIENAFSSIFAVDLEQQIKAMLRENKD